jgi:hypothetical protein
MGSAGEDRLPALTNLVCLLCLVTAITPACGGDGDDPAPFSQSFVEGAMTDVLRNAPETRWRLDGSVECDDQEDAFHWTCTAEAVVVAGGADKGKRFTLTVETTCGIDSVGKRICTRVSTTESDYIS